VSILFFADGLYPIAKGFDRSLRPGNRDPGNPQGNDTTMNSDIRNCLDKKLQCNRDVKLDNGRQLFGPHNQFQRLHAGESKPRGEGPWIEGDIFECEQEKAKELVMGGSAKLLAGGMFSIAEPDSEFPRLVLWRKRQGYNLDGPTSRDPDKNECNAKAVLLHDIWYSGKIVLHADVKLRIYPGDWSVRYQDDPPEVNGTFEVLSPNPKTFAKKQVAKAMKTEERLQALERATGVTKSEMATA
jgi:hypothetical protein